MKSFTHDIAISAVPFDTLLVADLAARLAPRLGSTPVSSGGAALFVPHGVPAGESPLRLEHARLVVLLHQRLWSHDEDTRRDEPVLRERVRRNAKSVCVVTLDAEPLPAWLAGSPTCALGKSGIEETVGLIVDAFAATGGTPREVADTRQRVAVPFNPDPERPYLSQSRALTALRREFESLAEWLEPHVRTPKRPEAGPLLALHCAPQRIIAQLESVGLSFSWLPGRNGTVADGRLMIIEWEGTITAKPGMGALQTAAPRRERTYRAEADGVDNWRWHADDAQAAQYTTVNLAAQWLAGAALAAGALTPELRP